MKTELRSKFRSLRKKCSERHAEKERLKIPTSLLRFDHWLIYAALPEEYPTRPFFEFLIKKNKQVYLPKTMNQDLIFYQISSWSQLIKKGALLEPDGISKPWPGTSSTLALVPGIVFNRLGQRIGFGRAFYDRFLGRHPSVLRVGIAFNEQLSLETWSDEDHDQLMDYVLCPSGIWGSGRCEFLSSSLWNQPK